MKPAIRKISGTILPEYSKILYFCNWISYCGYTSPPFHNCLPQEPGGTNTSFNMEQPLCRAPIVLTTQRLQLREMNFADMQSLSSILQDEKVMYAYNGAFSAQETAAWMQKQLQRYKEFGFGLWAVSLKNTEEMIGQCGITMQDYKGIQVPEIGYLFAYKYWHNGYATEAAIGCREYGFGTLHFKSLYSIIRDTNIPSQKVAVRNGMKKVDTIIKHYRGVEMPHWVYRITKN